ncbi:MAG: transglycosylase domain-containing protein [Ilumatobacteraceae bacterium]|nr:transglycosylase domain-containing protein [Ilumatobacteraceae bacterium]
MRMLGWLPRLALVIAAGALLITAVVVGVAPRIWQIANAHEELPVELPEFERLAQRTYVYDANGNEIALYELENSQPIAYEDLSPQVIEAFLVVEDKEFFDHDGVNIRSLVRATLSNFSTDAPQQGASTITMQVIKNDFLAGLERDGRYKLLQIHYARMLEKEMTKEEILERYLNTVFFGNNAYGIQAAAETYFGKTAAELTFIEAAFLAGLVRSPSGFDPINEPERSRARWLQVLDRLESDEYITEFEAERLAEEFVLPERVKSIPTRSTERSYFTEALRDFLLNRSDVLGDTPQERYNQLFRGGLRIHTTLDTGLQSAAEEARNALPDTLQGFDAALVSLDSRTGAIRAMVGGRGFQPGEREVNMALEPRQTGSSIKFFILAAALQAGAQAGDQLAGGAPCTLPNPGNEDEPFIITDAVSAPQASLAEHTWRSINCAFARLSQTVGLNRVVDTTYRMAASPYLFPGQTDRAPIEPFASFATGANEMSPLDMASGIQTIANEGIHHEPYYVEFIDDAEGNRIYTHFDPGTEVLTPDVALETVDVMKGVLTRGTARRQLSDFSRPAFGKTGTQQDNTNAWFAGGTKQLSTAVWVGDPDAYTAMRGIPEFSAVGVSRVQGGTFPAQIWGAYMEPAHVLLPPEDWQAPPPPERPNAQLVLPGNQCAFQVVGFDIVLPAGPPEGAPTTPPPPPDAEPVETAPPVRVPITARVDVGTTVPPDIVDPTYPIPTIPAGQTVVPC